MTVLSPWQFPDYLCLFFHCQYFLNTCYISLNTLWPYFSPCNIFWAMQIYLADTVTDSLNQYADPSIYLFPIHRSMLTHYFHRSSIWIYFMRSDPLRKYIRSLIYWTGPIHPFLSFQLTTYCARLSFEPHLSSTEHEATLPTKNLFFSALSAHAQAIKSKAFTLPIQPGHTAHRLGLAM